MSKSRVLALILLVILLVFCRGCGQKIDASLAEAVEGLKEELNTYVWLYGDCHEYYPYASFIGKTIDVSVYSFLGWPEYYVFIIADEEYDVFCELPMKKRNSNGYGTDGGAVGTYEERFYGLDDRYEFIQDIKVKIPKLTKPKIVMDENIKKNISDIKEYAARSSYIKAPAGEYALYLMIYNNKATENERGGVFAFFMEGERGEYYVFSVAVNSDEPAEQRLQLRSYYVDEYDLLAIEKVKSDPFYVDTITMAEPEERE